MADLGKKGISVVLSLFMALALLPALAPTAEAAKPWNGTTSDTTWYFSRPEPFIIDSEADLAGLAALVNGTVPTFDGGTLAPVDFAGKTITLADDLDLNSKEWTPIGDVGKPFKGSFDGGGHKVTGLAIGTVLAPSGVTYIGLFGYLGQDGEIKDLGVESAGIYSNANPAFVGVLAGRTDGVISGCYATGDVTCDSTAYAGGLVGQLKGSLTDCYATGAVSAGGDDSRVGGLVGYSDGGGNITDCYATGAVSAGGDNAYGGGLVGYSDDGGNITNCHATGTVSAGGDGASAGGLVGCTDDVITNCYATGTVSAGGDKATAGGLVGYSVGGSITGCHATGAVSSGNGGDLAYAGGLVGHSTVSVTDCYATGDASGDSNNAYVGGLAGVSTSSVTDCHATGDVSGDGDQAYVGGLVGFSTVGSITGCYATGDASVDGDMTCVGGLVGRNSVSVTDCYATGAITGGDGADVGGLVGFSIGSVTNCYATGDVTGGDSYVGGLVGCIGIGGGVTNCYAAGAVTGGSGGRVRVGGLAGVNQGTITHGYWNTNAVQTVGGAASAAGDKLGVGSGGDDATTAKTLKEMRQEAFRALLSANRGTGSEWAQDARKNRGMPYLASLVPPDGPPVDPQDDTGTHTGGTVTSAVTVIQPENGSVKISPQNPKRGDTVTITLIPDEGYAPGGVTVKTKSGKELPVTDNGDGTYTFKYGGLPVVIEAVFTLASEPEPEPEPWESPFADVKPGDWYYGDVRYVCENGLMQGISEDEFGAGLPMSRAMLITVLYRMAGEPDVTGLDNPFGDVDAEQWYTDAILWAAANGITTGCGDGTFGTDDAITREDLCVLLVRVMELMGIELPVIRDALDFADAGEVSGYAREAVMLLYQAGIIEGRGDGIFDPQSDATRAELAAMLHRFMEAVKRAQ